MIHQIHKDMGFSMVNMSNKGPEAYHHESGLEQAVLDLVRVGSGGFGSGVRQLATRLVRSVPPGVADPKAFRTALHEAMSSSTRQPGLRFAERALPTEEGSTNHLVLMDPHPDGNGLILAPAAMRDLTEIVEERQRSKELSLLGIGLTRTVLLSGPPGVGKTMTARWLAAHLEVPLVSVDLAIVLSSYLGSSGRNIRSAMEYAKSGPCVLLLDEFDALAKRRDDDTDIGELKRVVNVVLMELDRWPDTNLLVAATNHPHLLDSAVERRFDHHVELALPGLNERRRILGCLASLTELSGESVLDVAAELAEGTTGSDLTRLWQKIHRRSVLTGKQMFQVFLDELSSTAKGPGPARDRLWLAMAEHLGYSNRQIASLAGVSHPTVASAIKRARLSR